MDVKRKIWMRALSVFLATLMVIQILPLNAFAKDVVQKQAIEDTQPKVSVLTKSPSKQKLKV